MENRTPRYAANVCKALEAILWVASKHPGSDIYHIVKAIYFADKHHISRYGRPIIGDDYQAAQFGPLPNVAYGLLRGNPIEILALDLNGPLPFSIQAKYVVSADRDPNLRILSQSDQDSLEAGSRHVDGRSFSDIYSETHQDPAYVNAQGGRMDYRDFLPLDIPDRDEKIEFIEETADSAAL